MFGKLGRSAGAGRGSGKRPPSTPVQLHRPGEVGGSRPPIGASAPARARPSPQAAAAAQPGREETFSLEPGKLDFGAIIRLTPDIVEEIKRLEAQGGAAKIKFDANANNSAGNIVEVGGKEFRFTWSQEPPDLCNIYEECRDGDDGDGLLVECGTARRKLNVERILDESTKHHVKMRSEEAERKLKSRKAIVLDPTNPSVKSQAKSMAAAAVEGNMRRMGWKHKKEMFKKRKVENNQGAAAVSQTKSVSKSATALNGNFKGNLARAPSPQQPRPRALLSTLGTGNTLRGDTNSVEITPPLNINKEEIDISEKEMPTRVSRGSMQDISGQEGGRPDPSIDLRSLLISLLTQNPKGMSLKALEKAVGEKRIPNSLKNMEIALKNIAILQAPGRYFLKQGGQVESSKRISEGGSSPECLSKETRSAVPILSEKAIGKSLDQETLSSKHGEGSDLFERIDIMHDTEDPLDIEGKSGGNNEVRAGGSSESGSDSDSESDSSSESESGSRSRSRSKSRSPAGSVSVSSSSSESDGSSSSKEASDMDVDIMTSDDQKEVAAQRMNATTSKLSQSPLGWRSSGEHDINNNIEIDQNANGASTAIDLTDFGIMHERVDSVVDAKNLVIDRSTDSFEKQEEKTVEVLGSEHAFSFVNSRSDGRFFGKKAFREKQTVIKDGTGEQPDKRFPKASSKRSSNPEYLPEKPENVKRMKVSCSAEASFGKENGALSSENLCYSSPERPAHMDQRMKVTNYHQKGEKREVNLREGSFPEQTRSAASGSTDKFQSSPDFRDAANLAAEQPIRKVADSNGRKKTSNMEKPIKYAENLGSANKPPQTVSGLPESDTSSLKNMPVDKNSTLKMKPGENTNASDKYRAKIAKEIPIVNKKSVDDYISHMHNSDANSRGNTLRRELSDLELGEFRETITDGMGEDKRQFERNNSFKKMENRATISEANAADINTGKCGENAFSDSKRQSPNSFREVMNGKELNDCVDSSRSQLRLVQAQSRQSLRMDFAEHETLTLLEKCTESGGKNGTKIAATRMLKDDNRLNGLVDRTNVKESKSQYSNGLKGSMDRSNDVFWTHNDTDGRKSLEFSSSEENATYMKYKKDELGLRGPIKEFSMYKDYVREYQERYNHYCFLNKKLEKNRNDFMKVGDAIEFARGRDKGEYYNLVEKLREMYQQRGERHKEMKRIFIFLHEDLKNLKQRIKDFVEAHSKE